MSSAESDCSGNELNHCVFSPADYLYYFTVSPLSLSISKAASIEKTFMYSIIKRPNFKPVLKLGVLHSTYPPAGC